jgi:putative PIN family toxin of toxin-antitoxin system
VLVDTNVLISALLWPQSKPAMALFHVLRHQELVLCHQNIEEMRDVIGRKAPQALTDCDVFLAELAFDLVAVPECSNRLISDPKDQPILSAALQSGVAIIITGDKHFLGLQMERPRTMTPAQYLEFVKWHT